MTTESGNAGTTLATGGDAGDPDATLATTGGEGGAQGGGEGGDKGTGEGGESLATGQGAEGEGGGEGEGDAGKASDGAPEAYEAFQTPEGFEVDEARMGEFQTFAKEMNLTQENAQKVLDWAVAELNNVNTAQAEQWKDTVKGWRKEAAADKEYGGHNMKENMAHVARALQKFGTPELNAMLDSLGVGNHPELVRFFYRAGKELAEDQPNKGAGDGQARDAASVLYPDQGKG